VPRISAFYGIIIWLYRADHPPAHFHAQYGEHWAKIAIGTGRVLEGSLPRRALRLTREWAGLHVPELEANWARAQGEEPLEPIPPLP
jgi:Domain of unknown function (DUF4160)